MDRLNYQNHNNLQSRYGYESIHNYCQNGSRSYFQYQKGVFIAAYMDCCIYDTMPTTTFFLEKVKITPAAVGLDNNVDKIVFFDPAIG